LGAERENRNPIEPRKVSPKKGGVSCGGIGKAASCEGNGKLQGRGRTQRQSQPLNESLMEKRNFEEWFKSSKKKRGKKARKERKTLL